MKKYFILFAFMFAVLSAFLSPNNTFALKNEFYEVLQCDSVINITKPIENDDPFESILDVKNVTTKTLKTKVKIFVDNVVSGHKFTVCIGVNCYPEFDATWEAPDLFLIGAGKTLSDAMNKVKAFFHLSYNMSLGTSNFRVRIYQYDAPENYIEYPITYKVGPAGVNDNTSASEVAVYPNPAQNNVNLTFNGFQAVKVQLFDMIGNKVSENSVNGMEKATIDATSINAGSYIAVISDIYGKSIKRNVSIVK